MKGSIEKFEKNTDKIFNIIKQHPNGINKDKIYKEFDPYMGDPENEQNRKVINSITSILTNLQRNRVVKSETVGNKLFYSPRRN